MNIFRLAARLRKTPQEIRDGFTVEDYDTWLVFDRLLRDEAASK